MGGGYVSRPDFGMPQPDPAHPLTEFYLALQHALDQSGCFALPGLYACLQAPARRIYREEARSCLRLSAREQAGFARLMAPGQLQVLYSSLHVAADGAPAALLLTEECTRAVTAVQLLPPFVWEDPLPRCRMPRPCSRCSLRCRTWSRSTPTPPRWGGSWCAARQENAGYLTPGPSVFWHSRWRFCSGYTGKPRAFRYREGLLFLPYPCYTSSTDPCPAPPDRENLTFAAKTAIIGAAQPYPG